MYDEVFEGMRYTNDEIAEMFNKCFEDVKSNDLVLVKDIEVFSYCEHHLALMYNMKCHVGYIPNGKVIGLSKIARICDMVSKRLQLQERICADIADIMQKVCETENVIVIVEGEHSCMTARGIKSRGATTRTSAIRGLFDTDYELRHEVYELLK
jgi:GTP cyclohydrolase I